MIDVQDHRAGVEIPARRRLHARGEAAVGDLVLLRTDLLDFLAEEIHDVLLDVGRRRDRPGARRLRLRLHRREAPRVVERAEPRLRVELGALGGDAVLPLREQHVARRDRAILAGVHADVVGVDLRVAAAIHLHVPDEVPVLLIVRSFTPIADRGLGGRLLRRGRGSRLRGRRRGGQRRDRLREHRRRACEERQKCDRKTQFSKGITSGRSRPARRPRRPGRSARARLRAEKSIRRRRSAATRATRGRARLRRPA